jgi:hypothetical protein
MTTRILSWEQMVREADGPSYTRLSLQPWVYEFSNNRRFIDRYPVYNYADSFAFLLENGGGALTLQGGGDLVQEHSP